MPDVGAKDSGSLHSGLLAGLRDYIVEGNLAPRERVPEKQLCEQFGISRTPLREALKVLASEGLLELLPNRGARVRDLSVADIRDLFDLVGGLEALAGRLACDRISDDEIAEVEQIHQRMYLCYLRRDLPGYFAANQQIHDRIMEAARNAELLETWRRFTGRIRRIRFAANLESSKDRWSEALREHEAMLDALRRRSGDEMNTIMFNHFRKKMESAVEFLRPGEPG